MEKSDIIIIGAGIGAFLPHWSFKKGLSVTLIDKSGQLKGQAMAMAGYWRPAGCAVTTPGLISKAPAMLFDPKQPLFLKWSYLPKLMPWLVKYLKHANVADTKRIAKAMMPIVGDCWPIIRHWPKVQAQKNG